MNDGKKRQSSAELPAHKRFAKSRSRWIYPSFKNCVLRGLGQRPNKHETGGFRVNGICLFSQSGYRFALLAAFLPPFVPPFSPLPILQSEQGVLARFRSIFSKNTAFIRNISLNTSPDALCFFGYSYIMYRVEYYPCGGAV